ncbi:hypothetical protein HTVC100P_gp40 [Pelagibacter phage HTVC100P]|nr:hypothetical protein HTVC100P_gp40 [Pelagibacter phage HTVC100P]
MPFIGNQPALSYTSFAKQDFTTSATTSYTLDHPVTNENEIALFINFVRQEPTTAYTATNTNLTLTSATSASDDMYCVFLGKAIQTVNPPSGSVGISQLSATGTKDATTFLRGDNTFAVAGENNKPLFKATMSNNDSSVSDNTYTKVSFNTDTFDADSVFDTSNNRFIAPNDGKYFFVSTVYMYANSANGHRFFSAFYKNGSIQNKSISGIQLGSATPYLAGGIILNSTILDLSQNDYVEVYAKYDVPSGTVTFDTAHSSFEGFKIIT